jgi:GntR family transcriptional regulator
MIHQAEQTMEPKLHQDCIAVVERYWPTTDDLPKHEKLRKAIAASIIAGYWPSGARFPTEFEWVAATPCGLGTVQRALRSLVADGLIQRRQGSGTQIIQLGRPYLSQPLHMRFIASGEFADNEDRNQYLSVSTEVIQKQVTKQSGPWSQDIKQDNHSVIRIDRIMLIADEFEVYNVFYALADRFPELAEQPVEALHGTNLKTLIAQRYHMPVHKIRQRMRFETVPSWVASSCQWPAGAPASILNVVAYSFEGEPMYYQDYYIPPTSRTLDLGTPIRS